MDSIQPTSTPNMDILLGDNNFAAVEAELVGLDNRELYLRTALSEVNKNYDFVFIDCPPSLGLITLNAFCASHGLYSTIQCEYLALEGISQLLETLGRVQNIHKDISLKGIILTMFDQRNTLSRAVEEDVRKHFKKLVFDTVIPRNIRVSEAPSHGRPVLLYDLKCSGSQAYIRLAKELLQRHALQPIHVVEKTLISVQA